MGADGVKLELRQERPVMLEVALQVGAGELVALVGPSGSGKTTVLRNIAGLQSPDSGFIYHRDDPWFDRDRRIDVDTQQRRVGFVFQDYALFPHLDALANVAIALGHLASSARTEEAHALLEKVNLKGLERRLPAQLSGGQRQRVALARALAREPNILLLDEPFSAVDRVTRGKLQQELALLRRSIRTPILLVTHDLDEAMMLADRLYVLHRGRTLQDGAPAEVLRYPRDALVARLVGHRNIFSATVGEHDHERGLTRIRWQDSTLELELNPALAPGTAVDWVIHPAHIIMHRRDRPSFGERENPVHGRVSELLEFGESALVGLAVDGDDRCLLRFSVSRHSAMRNRLETGAAASVSLLAEGIHLMPPGG